MSDTEQAVAEPVEDVVPTDEVMEGEDPASEAGTKTNGAETAAAQEDDPDSPLDTNRSGVKDTDPNSADSNAVVVEVHSNTAVSSNVAEDGAVEPPMKEGEKHVKKSKKGNSSLKVLSEVLGKKKRSMDEMERADAAARKAEKDHMDEANHSRTSSRGSADGRRAIRRSVDLANEGKGGLTTGPHLNAAYATPLEEYTKFRRHYKVSPSFTGPIYVAEDVMVACAGCGGPVDPIRRVPVGRLFFHRTCVECFLCGLRSITEPYFQVGDRAVCSNCAEKGDARCVPREEAKHRKMVLGAIPGNAYNAFRTADRQRRMMHPASTLNYPTVPGVSAPSLSVGMLHNRRNTTRRTYELVQRQQHYTQNDCNILFKPVEEEPKPTYETKRIEHNTELPRLK